MSGPYWTGKYTKYREDPYGEDSQVGQETNSNGNTIAGVAYSPRNSQPDMYSILSWADQTRSPPDASVAVSSPLKAPAVPRRKIENRWETEAAYQYVWANKTNKVVESQKAEKPVAGYLETKDLEGSGAVRAQDIEHAVTGGSNPSIALDSAAGIQAAPPPPPKLSFTAKLKKSRTAKKRADLLKAGKGGKAPLQSRTLADTAFAEVCKKPAFHNYGRGNAASPWDSEQHHTQNAKAAAKMREKVGGSPEKDIPPPLPAAKSHHEKHSAKAAIPKQSASPKYGGGRRVSSPSGKTEGLHVSTMPVPAAPPPAPTAQSMPPLSARPQPSEDNEAVKRASAVPMAPSSRNKAAGERKGKRHGYRVGAALVSDLKPRPEALNHLSRGGENDPMNYKFLPNEWTELIKAAGTPNPRGISVSDCLDLFE